MADGCCDLQFFGGWWLEAGWLAVALVKRERRGVTEEAKH
jgi:hypothetical protein